MTTYYEIADQVKNLKTLASNLEENVDKLVEVAQKAEIGPTSPEFVPRTPNERRTEGTLYVLGIASNLKRQAQSIEDSLVNLAITSTTASNPQIQSKTGRSKPTLIRRRRALGL